MKIRIILSAILLLVALTSCDKENNKKITITKVGWVIENIPASYWSSTATNKPTCCYGFWIYYDGDNISLSDITSAKITIPGSGTWTIPLSSSTFDSQKKVIGNGGNFWWSSNIHALPLFKLTAKVELSNGNTASCEFTTHTPGRINPPNYNSNDFYYTYTTEDTTGLSSYYIPTLSRSIPSTVPGNNIKGVSSLTVKFTITDSNAYNGYLWLYDSSNNYIGYSKRFINTTTGNPESYLNNGSSLVNTGTQNTVTINDSDITYSGTKTFNDISKFSVLILDGAQFKSAGNYSSYDYRSRSELTSF
jgi:hypothetical protein